MSALEQNLADYLQLRRSLGHEMAEARWLLPGFVAYLDAHEASTVTIGAALDWAQQSPTGQPTTVGPRRMTAARGFARYLAGIYPGTEIPPLGLMPHRQRWRRPFIYSTADIEALMNQARVLIRSPLRAATYETLVGLLAAGGLRIGEAIKLDRSDINWTESLLLIRESKFGKSRLVPLHSTAMQALSTYTQLRDELEPRPKEPSFFVSQTHKRLCYAAVCPTFRHPVQPRRLLGQHHRGFAAGGPVLTGVDLVHERLARLFDLGEGRVVGTQVGVPGHDVGLGELHRGLHAALGSRVRRLAGQHRHPVMAGEVDRLLVADRDPGNMGHRYGLLVIGQDVGRGAAQNTEAAVQCGEHARRRPVPQRDDDPEAGPRQPGHEQNGLLPLDHGAVAEIVLKPHARFCHPGPVHPDMAEPPGRADLSDGPAGRTLRTLIAEGQEFLVCEVYY